jgi:hypothetical protein
MIWTSTLGVGVLVGQLLAHTLDLLTGQVNGDAVGLAGWSARRRVHQAG